MSELAGQASIDTTSIYSTQELARKSKAVQTMQRRVPDCKADRFEARLVQPEQWSALPSGSVSRLAGGMDCGETVVRRLPLRQSEDGRAVQM